MSEIAFEPILTEDQHRRLVTRLTWEVDLDSKLGTLLLAASRKQPPREFGFAHPFHADRHGGRAIRDAVLAPALDNQAPGTTERAFQPLHHFLLRPEILLQILHPFEIADDNPAGVAENVGDHENLVVALREHENANAPMWRRAREAVDAAATLLDAQPVPFRRVRA